MAYNKSDFYAARGTANSDDIGGSIVTHSYRSDVDDNAAIIASDYFSNNFGFDVDDIKTGDLLSIKATDKISLHEITALTTPTLGADLWDPTVPPSVVTESKGTAPVTMSGPFASGQAATLLFVKHDSLVQISFPALSVAATSGAIITSTALTASLRPLTSQNRIIRVEDNSVPVTGVITVSPAGIIQIGVGAAANNFTASNNAGYFPFSVIYEVA